MLVVCQVVSVQGYYHPIELLQMLSQYLRGLLAKGTLHICLESVGLELGSLLKMQLCLPG